MDAPSPAPERAHSLRWLLALLGAGVAFLLGWMAGRGDPAPAPAPTASTKRPEDVELRLDAGTLTLMPEGGLELRPIEPLGADGGAGGAAGSGGAQTP